ncbi:MAG: PAS domain S-box protein [Syntrophales bacterium]|nr:PAS domain S-box protein [Syntrophales bacterium]
MKESREKGPMPAPQSSVRDGIDTEGRAAFSIVQGFSIPAFVIGRDHRVIHWNRALEVLSGISASDIIGTDQHWRAFYDSTRPCMADLLVEQNTNDVPRWYAGKFRKSGLLDEAYEATDFFPALGERGKWLRFTAAVIRDSRGDLVGAVETLEDITDWKQAEWQLRESERRLSNIIEGFPISAFVIGIDHKVLYWNRVLEEISKIPGREVIGTNRHWRAFYREERPCMADLLVDETVETIPEWYEGKYSKSKLMDETYEATDFFPALGTEGKWLRFTASAIRNSLGVLMGAIETLEDITESRTAEEALKESRQNLLSIVQGFSIPAFVIDKEHRILHWNRALEKLSGIPAQEIVGTNGHWRAFYGEERPCMADLLVEVALDKFPEWYFGKFKKSELIPEAYEATDFFPALGEEGRWLRFTAAAIRDSGGKLVGAVETLEDITEKKSAESALQGAHSDLETRIAERTSELEKTAEALKKEISERRQTESELRRREQELELKTKSLEEVNAALNVLLERSGISSEIKGRLKELAHPRENAGGGRTASRGGSGPKSRMRSGPSRKKGAGADSGPTRS